MSIDKWQIEQENISHPTYRIAPWTLGRVLTPFTVDAARRHSLPEDRASSPVADIVS